MSVTFTLYQSDGSTLQYLIPVVFSAKYPFTSKELIEHKNVRGKGSIVVDAGESSWDLPIKGVFFASGYDAIIALVIDMESKILINTPYVLKITKSQAGGTFYSYNVKRITPIEYQDDNIKTDFLEFTVSFRVNSW